MGVRLLSEEERVQELRHKKMAGMVEFFLLCLL